MASAAEESDVLPAIRLASGANPDGLAPTAAPRPALTLVNEALRWTYVLRSRPRWVDDERKRDLHELAARESLKGLGLDVDTFDESLLGPRVVVRIPYEAEEKGWEARVFPWEYVLAAATRARRIALAQQGRPSTLTVMRELELAKPVPWPRAGEGFEGGLRALFVVCMPTELRSRWSLDGERDRLHEVWTGRSVPGQASVVRVLDYPTVEQLRSEIADFKPQLIHFAGVDSHQGLRELQQHVGTAALVEIGPRPDHPADAASQRLVEQVIAAPELMQDGVILRSESGYPRLVRAHELAQQLAATQHCAFLVSFNLWNTAARVAPLLVAEGATLAAIGFQDAFDDALAEFVHATLYECLLSSGWDLPQAFERTWGVIRQLPKSVNATGVTLWAGQRVLRDTPAAISQAAPAPATALLPREDVRVLCDIQPFLELNYAVVHNAQPLFSRFVLECAQPGADILVDVDIAVHMGMETACYRRRVVVLHRHLALTPDIHVPLTAELARAAREAINSSLRIEVRQIRVGEGGKEYPRLLYCNTHRLRLLPVDQWRDNQQDGRWLPSFVQPRDPAVTEALAVAQHYNRVLRDDPSAGFEGYQLAVPTDRRSLRSVDSQVQAIWATLLHEWRLGYINPPPTYSGALDSQRLRMPSTVRAHRAGTCIDLALLFAACLELIDVYPVIFLLKGHALPGWWRHPDFRDEYFNMPTSQLTEIVHASEHVNSAANAQVVAWHTGPASWREVRRWIREEKLVPIETVRLTENCGFVEAIEAGIEALSDREDYDSMLEIVTARMHQVTPLPLLKGGA